MASGLASGGGSMHAEPPDIDSSMDSSVIAACEANDLPERSLAIKAVSMPHSGYKQKVKFIVVCKH